MGKQVWPLEDDMDGTCPYYSWGRSPGLLFPNCPAVRCPSCDRSRNWYQYSYYVCDMQPGPLSIIVLSLFSPVWQSESSSPHNRGRYLMIEGAMITGGVCISYWLDFGLHYASSSVSWRFPFAFQIVFALIVCAIILDLPESPRLLVCKGRIQEAQKIHEALFFDESQETRAVGFSAIVTTLQGSSDATWKSLLSNKESSRNLHRFILAVAHSIFHQICGINVVIYYAPKIYQESLGMGATQTRIINATVNGLGYFFTSFIATGLIERIGRRKLMMIGSGIMATGMAVAAISSAFSSRSKVAAAVAAAFMFLVQVGFAIGWLAICWLYPAEIVPSKLRSQVNSIVVTTTWLFNFLIVQVTPIMLDKISWRSYVIFAAINVVIGVTVLLWYPETAGLSLEQVDEVFREGQSMRDVVKISLKRSAQSRAGEVQAQPNDKDMEDPNFCRVAEHVE